MQYNKNTLKKDINKLEKKQANSLGMTRCAMSGAGIYKGDIRNDIFLIDSKFTFSDISITVKKKDIEKIGIEAFNSNKIPILLISINGLERYVIERETFDEFREWKENLNGR